MNRDDLYRRIHAIPTLNHHGKGEQCFPITDAVLAALASSSPAPAGLDVERLAAARHRGLHPTYAKYSRCDCLGFARKMAEWDELARAATRPDEDAG